MVFPQHSALVGASYRCQTLRPATLGTKLIPPNSNFAGKAHCPSLAQYEEMYKRSIEDPDGFWAEIADTFVWQKKWDKVRDYSFEGNVYIKWFIDGKTNISRQRAGPAPGEARRPGGAHLGRQRADEHTKLTYRQLHTEVCKFANVLKSLGVKKGDRVCLYMQMIPAAADRDAGLRRIGAIHSVVFGAFSEDSLRDRIQDSDVQDPGHAGHGLAAARRTTSR